MEAALDDDVITIRAGWIARLIVGVVVTGAVGCLGYVTFEVHENKTRETLLEERLETLNSLLARVETHMDKEADRTAKNVEKLEDKLGVLSSQLVTISLQLASMDTPRR